MFNLLLSLFLAPAPPAPDLSMTMLELGHSRFKVRQLASARLRELGLLAIPALLKARKSKDPEVVFRANVLWSAYRDQRIKQLLGGKKPPMLDSLWYDRSREYPAYLSDTWLYYASGASYQDRLKVSFFVLYNHRLVDNSKDGPDFFRYRDSTLLVLSEWLELGIPDKIILSTLQEMRQRDKVYLKQMGKEELP